MTKRHADLVSRGTAAAFGLALLYGAWRVAAAATWVAQDAADRNAGRGSDVRPVGRRSASGAGHLYLGAGVLAVVGLPCVLYAVVPAGLAVRLFRPDPPETGDRYVA